MLKQYDLVNNCLSELRKSDLPEKYRWKLEVHLQQLRRLLLLEQVAEVVRDDPESEQDFLDLHREVKHACDPESPLPRLDLLVAVPSEIKKSLYSYCRREAASENYSHDGSSHLSHQ